LLRWSKVRSFVARVSARETWERTPLRATAEAKLGLDRVVIFSQPQDALARRMEQALEQDSGGELEQSQRSKKKIIPINGRGDRI
jgi:hypothetical protein